jgi:hypothetical protein
LDRRIGAVTLRQQVRDIERKALRINGVARQDPLQASSALLRVPLSRRNACQKQPGRQEIWRFLQGAPGQVVRQLALAFGRDLGKGLGCLREVLRRGCRPGQQQQRIGILRRLGQHGQSLLMRRLELLEQQLGQIELYPSFVMVLNGHLLNSALGRLESTHDFGNFVHQMLVNYQMQALGGGAALRLVEFLPAGKTEQVTAHCPYYGTWMTDSGNQFVLTNYPPPLQ